MVNQENKIRREIDNISRDVKGVADNQEVLNTRLTEQGQLIENQKEAVQQTTQAILAEVGGIQKKMQVQEKQITELRSNGGDGGMEFERILGDKLGTPRTTIELDLANPMIFIRDLREELEKQRIRDWNTAKSIILAAIKPHDHVLQWFEFVRNGIGNFEEFATKFKETFWSREIQREARRKLTNGRYHPGKSKSMAEYFLSRYNVAKFLEPPLQEDELLSVLSEHYDATINQARLARGIESVQEFVKLLSTIGNDWFLKHKKDDMTKMKGVKMMQSTQETSEPQEDESNWRRKHTPITSGYQGQEGFFAGSNKWRKPRERGPPHERENWRKPEPEHQPRSDPENSTATAKPNTYSSEN